jgi:hypothetical protein
MHFCFHQTRLEVPTCVFFPSGPNPVRLELCGNTFHFSYVKIWCWERRCMHDRSGQKVYEADGLCWYALVRPSLVFINSMSMRHTSMSIDSSGWSNIYSVPFVGCRLRSDEIFEQTKQMRLEVVRGKQRNKIRSRATLIAIKEAMSPIR